MPSRSTRRSSACCRQPRPSRTSSPRRESWLAEQGQDSAHETGLRKGRRVVVRQVQGNALLAAIGRVVRGAALPEAGRLRLRASDWRSGHPALEDKLVWHADRRLDLPRQIHRMVIIGAVGIERVVPAPNDNPQWDTGFMEEPVEASQVVREADFRVHIEIVNIDVEMQKGRLE